MTALEDVAERVWFERTLAIDAPELATVERWIAASPSRQKQIANTVVVALSEYARAPASLVEITSFGGPPIAIIDLAEQQYSIVPGGTFEMGFSADEEAVVRAHAEQNIGRTNQYELYWSLLDNAGALRPIVPVRIGPQLVGRGPGQLYPIDDVATELERSVFRIPSEAEWEYLARGGIARELTYFGNEVPDEPDEYLSLTELAASGSNAFGLWGFGFDPELCADRYSDSHEGAALDGTPRRGSGPRVARGGAGQLYMWQDTGEWQLLMNATRGRSTSWKYEIAMRYTLGIVTPAT
jgi:hypothetical protein